MKSIKSETGNQSIHSSENSKSPNIFLIYLAEIIENDHCTQDTTVSENSTAILAFQNHKMSKDNKQDGLKTDIQRYSREMSTALYVTLQSFHFKDNT